MFRASDHTYYVDGRRTKGSVTGMIHAFCAPFDAGMVITRMMRGSNWPRAGYLKSDVSFTWMSRLGVLCPEILGLYSGSPRDDERISKLLRDLSSGQDIADELEQLTLSRDEIKEMWAARGREAAHYGTYMHYLFEASSTVIRWRAFLQRLECCTRFCPSLQKMPQPGELSGLFLETKRTLPDPLTSVRVFLTVVWY